MSRFPKIISNISPDYVIGIDEAGRGPLAGPVAVAAVKIGRDFNKNFFRGVKDSKQTTEEERKFWFDLAKDAHKNGDLDFSVTLISHLVIDKYGMTKAVALGIKRNLQKLSAPADKSHIFLDGLLKAPEEYVHQLTIIKGDEKVPIISLASILAKVTRDKHMLTFAKKYPQYGFERHKGYGTKEHREAIKKFGITPIHRVTFLKNILE